MSIINILGFEDQKYDWYNYTDLSNSTNVIDWFNNNIKTYVNNSGYNHSYLYTTRYYRSRSSTITSLPASSLYDVVESNYKLLNIDLHSRGVSPYGVSKSNYANDILSISFNLNLASGANTNFKMLLGGVTNYEMFRVNSLNNQYTLYNKNLVPLHSGYLANGTNSIGLLYKFSSPKLEFKINGVTSFRGGHEFALNDINNNSKDVEIQIHPSFSVSRSGTTTITDYVTLDSGIKFSDCVITDNELYHNHKVLLLNPIATKSGVEIRGHATYPYYGSNLTLTQAFNEIEQNNYTTTNSGVFLVYSTKPPYCSFNVFTPTTETSGKQVHAFKSYFRVKSLQPFDGGANAYNHYVTGLVEQSGKFDFQTTYNYGTAVYGIGDAPGTLPQTHTYNKVYTYNPYTGTNWSENDLKNISIGASGQIRLTDIGAFVLLGEATPTSGDYFDNVKFFCKTQELQSSGQTNFYTKGHDCITNLRPDADILLQHSGQWNPLPVWSQINQDPDLIGDDSTFATFNQSGGGFGPSNLYYIGNAIRSYAFASGTNQQIYDLIDTTYEGFRSRFLYNEPENKLVYGSPSTSIKQAVLDDQIHELTTGTQLKVIDWKTNIGYGFTNNLVNTTLFAANGQEISLSDTSLGLSAGTYIIHHDIDYKNNEGYYVASNGSIFRQNLSTLAVSGIGSVGTQIGDNSTLQQFAAFDFDRKRIFFVPYFTTIGQAGIAQTTFSGTIPAFTYIKTRSTNPANSSYFDKYNALTYDKWNDKLYYAKVNNQYIIDSGTQTAGVYQIYPGSSGDSALVEVTDATGSSGLAYGLALDAPRYNSTAEFNLSDIPGDITTGAQQFSNVHVKISAKEKVGSAYVFPRIYGSGGDLLWRPNRYSSAFFPSGQFTTQEPGLFNSAVKLANNQTFRWQNAKLKLDIHYPNEYPNKSGELDIYAVEVRAACSGVFASAPRETSIFPLYTAGVGVERKSLDLHTIAGTSIAQVDLFMAGHIPTSSGLDLFIRYSKVGSGIDFVTKGITRHSGSMNMFLAAKPITPYSGSVEFFSFGTNNSGIAGQVPFYLDIPESGGVNGSMNMSISGWKYYSQTGSMNMMIHSPIKSQAGGLDMSIANMYTATTGTIRMSLKGAVDIPCSSTMNLFIARDKESAASHIPMSIFGPSSVNSSVNFMTFGKTTSSGQIDFITYAEKDDTNNTIRLYTHGY